MNHTKRILTLILALGVIAILLILLLCFLFGCFFSNRKIDDGTGMVNYSGIMLEALRGDWHESGSGSYSITFLNDYTFNLRYNNEPLLENAQLTLYLDSTNTDEYHKFDINPNVFTDAAGDSVEITKASHENGVVILELTASDGTESTISFYRMPDSSDDLLDGPGSYYYGYILDDAITGYWCSTDGCFTLDFEGKFADFTVDGVQLASKDGLAFVDHSFSAGDDLNERCELYPSFNCIDETDDPPLTISEMWYQAEHIYMNVIWLDGKTEEIVFSKQDKAMPEGNRTETPDRAESEVAATEQLPQQ